METQNRWKSKITWAGIISAALILVGNLGLYDVLGITQDKLQVIFDSFLTLLVMVGVLNNPTDPNKF